MKVNGQFIRIDIYYVIDNYGTNNISLDKLKFE